MKILHALYFAFLAVAAGAADSPYNETADAKLEIRQALTQAATAKTPVIIVAWAIDSPGAGRGVRRKV